MDENEITQNRALISELLQSISEQGVPSKVVSHELKISRDTLRRVQTGDLSVRVSTINKIVGKLSNVKKFIKTEKWHNVYGQLLGIATPSLDYNIASLFENPRSVNSFDSDSLVGEYYCIRSLGNKGNFSNNKEIDSSYFVTKLKTRSRNISANIQQFEYEFLLYGDQLIELDGVVLQIHRKIVMLGYPRKSQTVVTSGLMAMCFDDGLVRDRNFNIGRIFGTIERSNSFSDRFIATTTEDRNVKLGYCDSAQIAQYFGQSILSEFS